MSKFNNIAVLLIALLLGACQGRPTPEPAPEIPPQAEAETQAPVEAPEVVDAEPAAEPVDENQWVYQQAIDALKNGNTDFALELLTKVSEADPEQAFVFTNLGLAYIKLKKFDLAETAFREAIARDDEDAVAHNHLGVLERRKGEFAQALEHYRRALEIDDEYAAAHLNLGILFDIYLQDLEQAVQFYRKYQSLISEENSQVAGWIADIERRLKSSGAGGQG